MSRITEGPDDARPLFLLNDELSSYTMTKFDHPTAFMPNSDKEWQDRVRGMLRAELARRNLSYVDLADRLRAIGVEDTPKNLSNKIARARFTAAFFMQCMRAIGCRTIDLDVDE